MISSPPVEAKVSPSARSVDVLERVCSLQSALLQQDRPDGALFAELLAHVTEFSGSTVGLVGEVFYDQGSPCLQTRATIGSAWYDANHAAAPTDGLVLRNLDSPVGRVLASGELVVSNDCAHEVPTDVLPQGHPAILTFAGIPVRIGGQFLGMIALANRPGGYDASLLRSLSPLVTTAGSLLLLARTHRARAAAEAAVARRLAFERLILGISTHFNNAAPADFDRIVNLALLQVGRFVEADRSYLFLLRDDGVRMDNTHEWCADGIRPKLDGLKGLPVTAFAFALDSLGEGHPFIVPDIAFLPPEADDLRATLERQQIRSLVLVPIVHQHRLEGFVGFDAVRAQRNWSNDDSSFLRVLSENVGHLLRRIRSIRRFAESDRRFRLIAAHVRQAFFLVSHDYRQMLYVSPAFEHLWGVPCDEVYADPLSWLRTIDPEFRPGVQAALSQADRQETTTEYPIRRPNGIVRWVRVQTFPVLNDHAEVEQIAGVAEDVTDIHHAAKALAEHSEALEVAVRARTEELTAANTHLRTEIASRVQVEDELRRSTAALRTVAEAMPIAVLILNAASVRFLNPSAEALFGVTAGADLTACHPSIAALSPFDFDSHEVEIIHPDTFPRELRLLSRTVDFEGRPHRVLAAVDITEQRRAERMLRQHQSLIARATHIGNMEGLASAVAHELNQPLSAIVGWTGGLHARLERGSLSQEDLRTVVEHLRSQALRAGELMRKLRSFSSRGGCQSRTADIDRVCQNALAQLAESAAAASVQVNVDLHADAAHVAGDTVQLEVVVASLLRNAIEAVSSPTTSNALPATRLVELSTRRSTNAVTVSIRDHGPGVPNASRSAIFEPLVSTKPDGLGVGLPIARAIVEAHRGHLALVEIDGPGACFEITLPESPGGSDA